jgi:hypothetical protein
MLTVSATTTVTASERRPCAGLVVPSCSLELGLRPGMQVWLDDCVEDALRKVAERGLAFRTGEVVALTEREEVDRLKRYDLLESLLAQRVPLDGRSGREVLGWIVAGYLQEFVRQTLCKLPPLNIANPQRPQPVAKAYWESVPREAFQREIFPGVRHTALSYHLLQEEHFRNGPGKAAKTGRKAAWDGASELLRASIDTFRVRGRELFPEGPLRASIYNDHLYVIEFARRSFCRIPPLPSSAA